MAAGGFVAVSVANGTAGEGDGAFAGARGTAGFVAGDTFAGGDATGSHPVSARANQRTPRVTGMNFRHMA